MDEKKYMRTELEIRIGRDPDADHPEPYKQDEPISTKVAIEIAHCLAEGRTDFIIYDGPWYANAHSVTFETSKEPSPQDNTRAVDLEHRVGFSTTYHEVTVPNDPTQTYVCSDCGSKLYHAKTLQGKHVLVCPECDPTGLLDPKTIQDEAEIAKVDAAFKELAEVRSACVDDARAKPSNLYVIEESCNVYKTEPVKTMYFGTLMIPVNCIHVTPMFTKREHIIEHYSLCYHPDPTLCPDFHNYMLTVPCDEGERLSKLEAEFAHDPDHFKLNGVN